MTLSGLGRSRGNQLAARRRSSVRCFESDERRNQENPLRGVRISFQVFPNDGRLGRKRGIGIVCLESEMVYRVGQERRTSNIRFFGVINTFYTGSGNR